MENTRPKECHKCPRNGKNDPYCWQKCIGPAEKSDKGRTIVRTGGLEDVDEFLADHIDEDYESGRVTPEDDFIRDIECCDDELDPDSISEEAILNPSDNSKLSGGVTAQLSEDVERALVLILANLFGGKEMTDTRLCIFRHIYKGEDFETIGRTLPVPMSKQAVFKHLRKIVEVNPLIGKVIMEMKRKGHSGARRKQVQLDLFSAMGVSAW